MLANPNKQIDLLFCTVPQKYFTLILLVLAKVVLPYDWISIVAILVVGTILHMARARQILNPAVNAIERLVGCGRACNPSTFGYITAAEGLKNAETCSDDAVPFNRRLIKGPVRNNAAYKQRVAEHESSRSITST